MIGMGFTNLEEDWPRVNLVRIWDIGCTWRDIHKAHGEYDWTRLDAVVEKCHSIGASIIYVIGGTPRWLATNPNDTTAAAWIGPGSNSLWTNADELNLFTYELTNRYKGCIQFYEFWNEPQLKEFLNPYDATTCTALATATARFHKNVAQWDPNAKVLGASVLPRKSSGGMTKAATYIGAMKSKAWPVHGVTCHIYPEVGTNYNQWATYLEDVRLAYKNAGAPDAMNPWITETLYDLLGAVESDSTAQANVIGTYAKAKGMGVTRILWYAWNRPDLGGMQINHTSAAWYAIVNNNGK